MSIIEIKKSGTEEIKKFRIEEDGMLNLSSVQVSFSGQVAIEQNGIM